MAQEAILEKVNGEVHISKSFDFMCSQLRNGRYRVKNRKVHRAKDAVTECAYVVVVYLY